MKVSIITSCYNREATIRGAVRQQKSHRCRREREILDARQRTRV